jgi:alpha-tubulin suppressor-like RCC1 family protein
MPATNYTPIQLYRSTTSGNTPLAANMSAGEIALNIADNDMSMWMENASGTVKRFFNNPAALKYPTADGTSGQVIVTDGSGNLSFATPAGGALTNNVRQAVTSSATTTLNLNSGNVIDLTMAANITTLSFTNVPASGTPILIQIVVRNASDGTAYTIVWPNSVYWSGQYAAATLSTVQTAPTLASGSNGVTVIALLTTDGGTKWRGWVEATIPGGFTGALYAWGYGAQGQLGQGNTVATSSPVQVGALLNWSAISAQGQSVLAVKTDGTLWAWGDNFTGRLGLNNRTNFSSPIQVGSNTNWSIPCMGGYGSFAITTAGTLWAIGGFNQFGVLGLNDTTNRSSPSQIGAATDWAQISGGYGWTLARKTTGTLWSWGKNTYGTLGQNSTANISSPKQIGALTTWSSISARGGVDNSSAGFAIKTDGTLWSWGRDYNVGQLGQNTLNAYVSSPVQVGALTDWSKVYKGEKRCFAIKTDGTLWAWGSSQDGGLGTGLGNYNNRSSPVQIGALTDWSKVAPSTGGNSLNCIATKTDGTLWSWGYKLGLGQNTFVNCSSPIKVGSLTNWTSGISMGVRFGMGIIASTVNPA